MHKRLLNILRGAPSPVGDDVSFQFWPLVAERHWGPHCDQLARITGSVPLSFWATPDAIARAVSRCEKFGAKLTLHVTPPVPEDSQSVTRASDQFERQWEALVRHVSRAECDNVTIHLERFRYRTVESRENQRCNQQVARYNALLYWISKKFVGNPIPVRRFGHLATSGEGPGRTRNYTTPFDPVDDGYSVPLYTVHDRWSWIRKLRETVAHAATYDVHEGSVWMPLGATWLGSLGRHMRECTRVAGGMYQVPLDPATTYTRIRYLVDPQYREDPRYSFVKTVHTIAFWVHPFDKLVARTGPWHLAAALAAWVGQPFDPTLRKWQAELWASVV